VTEHLLKDRSHVGFVEQLAAAPPVAVTFLAD